MSPKPSISIPSVKSRGIKTTIGSEGKPVATVTMTFLSKMQAERKTQNASYKKNKTNIMVATLREGRRRNEKAIIASENDKKSVRSQYLVKNQERIIIRQKGIPMMSFSVRIEQRER